MKKRRLLLEGRRLGSFLAEISKAGKISWQNRNMFHTNCFFLIFYVLTDIDKF